MVHHTRLRQAGTQQTVLEDKEIQQEVTEKQMLPDSGLDHEDDNTEDVEESDAHEDLSESESNAVASLLPPENGQNVCADTLQTEAA